MKTRDANLVYQEVQSSNASTKAINLDIVDPISALGFEFTANGGTTSNINNPLYDCITKIEIVSGADVIASLSCREAQAFQWYKTGKRPTMRIDEKANGGDWQGFMMLFGRYLWDQEYALNLNAFKNPQLRITWDLAAIRAVAADTAFATGTFKISAWAKVMEDLPPPGKYLMQKTIDTWTGGTSGDRRKELPVDYPYRLMVLQTYLSGNDLNENISKLKMTCDTDKFVPFERYMKEFGEEMAQLFGRPVFWKSAMASNGDSIWLPVTMEPQVSIIQHGNAGLHNHGIGLNYCYSGIANVFVYDDTPAAYTTDQVLHLLIEGHGIHSTVPIPFGDMARPETWFVPPLYKKIELVMTEAAAAANRIALEQVRPN